MLMTFKNLRTLVNSLVTATLFSCMMGDASVNSRTDCLQKMFEWCSGSNLTHFNNAKGVMSDGFGVVQASCKLNDQGCNCTLDEQPWFSCLKVEKAGVCIYKRKVSTFRDADGDICLLMNLTKNKDVDATNGGRRKYFKIAMIDRLRAIKKDQNNYRKYSKENQQETENLFIKGINVQEKHLKGMVNFFKLPKDKRYQYSVQHAYENGKFSRKSQEGKLKDLENDNDGMNQSSVDYTIWNGKSFEKLQNDNVKHFENTEYELYQSLVKYLDESRTPLGNARLRNAAKWKRSPAEAKQKLNESVEEVQKILKNAEQEFIKAVEKDKDAVERTLNSTGDQLDKALASIKSNLSGSLKDLPKFQKIVEREMDSATKEVDEVVGAAKDKVGEFLKKNDLQKVKDDVLSMLSKEGKQLKDALNKYLDRFRRIVADAQGDREVTTDLGNDLDC